MKYGNPIIEKKEIELLRYVISTTPNHEDNTSGFPVRLRETLRTAKILPHRKVPEDVVRMGSKVTIETPWKAKRTYKIVVPEKRDLVNFKISILTPMGQALYGYAEGDSVEWEFPMGTGKIKILKVEQSGELVKLEKL